MRHRYAAVVGLAAVGLAAAAAAPPAEPGRVTVSFRHGVGGYAGGVDLEIWALSPNTSLEGNINASSDQSNGGAESQVLVRFDDVVGDKAGRVPPKATVHEAKLTVAAFDQGDTVNLHRMLVPWKKTATWNSLVAGVTADGLEATKQRDSFTFGKIANSASAVTFDVTDAVQGWANGKPNHGWVFLNTGTNGWDFYMSEYDDPKQRPKLTVEFTPAAK